MARKPSTIITLNILKLLKSETKTWLQLWDSGCFYNPKQLTNGLKLLRKMDLIDSERFRGIFLYRITTKGLLILSGFPSWETRPVRRNVQNIEGYHLRKMREETALGLDVVVPIG